jgi:hypothetical protein
VLLVRKHFSYRCVVTVGIDKNKKQEKTRKQGQYEVTAFIMKCIRSKGKSKKTNKCPKKEIVMGDFSFFWHKQDTKSNL